MQPPPGEADFSVLEHLCALPAAQQCCLKCAALAHPIISSKKWSSSNCCHNTRTFTVWLKIKLCLRKEVLGIPLSRASVPQIEELLLYAYHSLNLLWWPAIFGSHFVIAPTILWHNSKGACRLKQFGDSCYISCKLQTSQCRKCLLSTESFFKTPFAIFSEYLT